MDPNYPETTWNLLRGAISEIHKKNASGLSFEELYRNAYNMVLHKYGDKLYGGLKEVLEKHLDEVAGTVASAQDDDFLQVLNEAWNDHKTSMLMIRDILMYMDRVYVSHNSLPSVYDMGLTVFHSQVALHKRIKNRLLKILLEHIQNERNGEKIDSSLMRNITQMLVSLGLNSRSVYETDFEQHFLSTSSEFYKVESTHFIYSNSCSDYMIKVEQRLKEEMDRVQYYLDSGTEPKIKEVTERELISNHMKTLVDMPGSGLVSMLKDDKIEDLKRMYHLLGRVQKGHDLMREVLEHEVKETGKQIVSDPEKQNKENSYVQALLNLKDKYDNILAKAFMNDKNFQHTLNQAFEFFINMDNRSPEYISLFIDEKLRKGLKGASEEETEKTLDKVMMLFRFIQEKDVFEKYYKQHLAKRLLLGRSVSDDAERGMIAKLKTECGYQFTSKLEGMFTDMKTSSDMMDSFKNWINNMDARDPLAGIDLNVSVLTTGFWPTQSSANCVLPAEVAKCCEIFKNFYLKDRNGRRLTWQTNMGTAEIRAFFTKKHELNVSTYQMCILLLFNSAPQMSYKEILSATGIPIPDLKRNLLTLSSPKYKILVRSKNEQEKDIPEDDVFKFNDKFRSKLFRVKILGVVQKETVKQRTVTQQKIDEDRKHQIEAAIVRVMKARKKMEHSNLIAEVTKQLQSRFRPNPIIIKKRIESLIEREYLERSKTDRKMYQYLA
eukprot:TRINITY_DN1169_c0_g2_i2.p1 TRINITY_DN1169_c0_g2~~TRINITY_DN1169_c0_g2_i2.p1  ORF type:complete len:744 (-),score=149.38 TRINITY_DN1169_c0_g2_i2:127-2286(-)